MRYEVNKANAVTRNVKPSKTDQSATRDTDINVIVSAMLNQGREPGQGLQPVFTDLTQYPTDLRGMIEMARSLNAQMKKLPPQLQNLGPQQILALSPEALKRILTPPDEQTAKPSSEEKK